MKEYIKTRILLSITLILWIFFVAIASITEAILVLIIYRFVFWAVKMPWTEEEEKEE